MPIPRPSARKRATPPFRVQSGRQRIAASTPINMSVTRYCGAERKLTTALAKLTRNIAALHRPRDAAVLADAPEVHGHQKRGDQGDADAVEHVETQQGSRPHEPAAQEPETRVVGGGDELDVADLQ